MNIQTILLVISALVPAIALCIYVYKKDRVEKEPLWLLILLLISGVVICFPVVAVGGPLGDAITNFFGQFGTGQGNDIFLSPFLYRVYLFFDNFFAVALVEEGFKWLAMIIITSKSKHFNCVFDGMIYAIFVSLGFAGYENILYVLGNGWQLAIIRALTAVPGHMFDAVIMGYFYSMWRITTDAKKQESLLIRKNIVKRSKAPFKSAHLLAFSLIVPILTHGFYDYNCSVATTFSMIIFFAFLIGLYVYCFGKIKKMSKTDMSYKSVAASLVYKKYKNDIDAYNRGIHREIEEAISGNKTSSDTDLFEFLLDDAFKK